MNKVRRKGQEIDLGEYPSKTDKRGNKISPNIKIIHASPFPNRAERRMKVRKRAGYTRTDSRIKKANSLLGRVKQKSSIMKKIIWLFKK